MFDFLKENVASINFCNTLVITGSSDTPMQVTQGLNIPRHDLKTTHEEADLIIIQQCYGLIFNSGCNSVTIISDDTDVFVLACYYFPIERSDVTVIMESTKSCRAIVDIGKTATKHKSLLSSLLAAHALTGCDSVCCYHGIGKKTAIKVTKQRKLFFLGELSSDIQDVVSEATAFIGDCYGISDGETMSDKRQAFVFCSTLYTYMLLHFFPV